MSFFDKVKEQASNLGNSISNATSKLSDEIFSSNENEKLIAIRAELDSIENELSLAYAEIGKRYVESSAASNKNHKIEIADTLKRIKPKLSRKQELEDEIVNIEKSLKDQFVMQEKTLIQNKFNDEKNKLDKALKLEVISQAEYKEKLKRARVKLDNFDEIRKIEKQFDMKLITEEEMKSKLTELGIE